MSTADSADPPDGWSPTRIVRRSAPATTVGARRALEPERTAARAAESAWLQQQADIRRSLAVRRVVWASSVLVLLLVIAVCVLLLLGV